MNRFTFAFMLLALTVFVLSCAGGSNSPIQPNSPGDSAALTGNRVASSPDPQLWGLWDVSWNPSQNAFEAIPLRSAMFAVNVVKFINASDLNLIIQVNSIQSETDYRDFDLNIGFKHPFPGLDIYTGFDVMGVFMGQGSELYPGSGGFPVAGPDDQQLLNPDGYTRRFNATEFTGAGQIKPLQGYIPGAKGTPGYTPSAVINPYKYFADGLDANADPFTFLGLNDASRGCFKAGSINYRNFLVRMPNSLLKFQYAILANWEPNKNHPQPPDTLDDFSAGANSQEAVAIKVVDSTDAYYVSETVYGGDISLDITPWDWSATCVSTVDEYSVKLYSPAWTGPFDVNMAPTVQGNHNYTFHASIPSSMLIANGIQPVWIEVSYPGFDYSSPIGVSNDATGPLTVYFKTQVNVLPYDPSTLTDNFIYGFADSNFLDDTYQVMNPQLFTNMLNLPLKGTYAQNKKVLLYEGRADNYEDYNLFADFITSLGYEWQNVEYSYPNPPLLDTTGVKMLIIGTYHPGDYTSEDYHPEEIQAIKDFLNGGGIVIILMENAYCYEGPSGTHLFDQLASELNLDFSFPNDCIYNTYPYIDITPDPITAGISQVDGAASGRFEVFGDAVSLVRGKDYDVGAVYTAICKSPWKG